jgi:hypothetical protein
MRYEFQAAPDSLQIQVDRVIRGLKSRGYLRPQVPERDKRLVGPGGRFSNFLVDVASSLLPSTEAQEHEK